MSAGDEHQVLSQAEIDAMLGNVSAGSELDDPLLSSAAPTPASADIDRTRPAPSRDAPAPPPVDEPVSSGPPAPDREPSRTPGQEAGKRGLFRKILGKSPPSATLENPPTPSAAPTEEASLAPQRPRPALDIEDDLVAAADGADDLESPTSVTPPASEPTAVVAALDAADDVMSVFLEHEGMDPTLRRLVERIPDVSVDDLLAELREIRDLLGIAPGANSANRAA